MRLKMVNYKVNSANFGENTAYRGGTMTINQAELRNHLLEDKRLQNVELDLALPGEKTRVIHILDAIEPRLKPDQSVSAYPGFLSLPYRVGSGTTMCLAGMTVLICAEFPEFDANSMMGANEAIVDMVDHGAALTPLANNVNLVLTCSPNKPYSTETFITAVRMAGFKAAAYLSDTLRNLDGGRVEEYYLQDKVDGLPNLAALFHLCSVSLPLRESFYYGFPVGNILPVLAHPNEVLDGAIVENYFVYGSVRNPTYFYQNSSLVKELYAGHGKTHNFIGVLVNSSSSTSDHEKMNKAATAANIAKMLDVDGVIISGNAGGHHLLDFMISIREMERSGIRTSGILNELANADGTDYGLVTYVDEADALVSTGNREELVELPPMEKVYGGKYILDSGSEALDSITVPYRNIFCANTMVGDAFITAKEY